MCSQLGSTVLMLNSFMTVLTTENAAASTASWLGRDLDPCCLFCLQAVAAEQTPAWGGLQKSSKDGTEGNDKEAVAGPKTWKGVGPFQVSQQSRR